MASIRTNKKSLIRWKIYIDRAKMYIGYIQFLMIGFVFLKSYQDSTIGKWVFDNLFISVPILFAVFIILSLILGRIDTLLGLREEELRNSSESNPVMRDIQSNLEQIKFDLEEIKNQNKIDH